MKSIQPNFEKVKTAFYQAFADSYEADTHILRETIIAGKLLGSFNSRLQTFKADFNKWLDSLDIRTVGQIIDVLNKTKTDLPGWIKRKDFVIDYNQNEALDLIQNYHE